MVWRQADEVAVLLVLFMNSHEHLVFPVPSLAALADTPDKSTGLDVYT
jgi:hypothetical protein